MARLRFVIPLLIAPLLAGCPRSPEYGRPRGGGNGGDGHNYVRLPQHAPSKIDATKRPLPGNRPS